MVIAVFFNLMSCRCQYLLTAEISRSYMQKTLSTTLEFILENRKGKFVSLSLHFVMYIHKFLDLIVLLNILTYYMSLQDLFHVLQFNMTLCTFISHKIHKSTLFCLQFDQVYIVVWIYDFLVDLKESWTPEKRNKTSSSPRR